MLITPSFLDILRDKVPLSALIGRKVKLTRRGHEYIGLCPFHHEKTPSFTINDDKGFYHCFGCGAHGDVVRYLTEAEKLPFMEAVETLANMAGVPMPKPSKEEQRLEAQRTSLTAIMEEACHFFQEQLFGMRGKAGRDYLIGRGISAAVAKQFRLGYAPSGSALTQHLQAKGFNMRECQKLGLIAQNQETKRWHDYFYDRVMFPILDRRRRVIGFGGRLLEKGEPKYLNSPETELFHKGEQLYALPQAIETIRKKNQAVLVEGYMDVIALHSAGFTGAVAPLGTALTENQIKILWQSCDEPLICFDGDGAGRKAAIRALYRALPILSAGKSLRFVTLPNPYDPDDIIRKKSPEAFATLLAESRQFADMLWDDLTGRYQADTPERQALLEKEVKETIAKIQDPRTRAYYQDDFKNRLWKHTHQKRKKSSRQTVKTAIHSPVVGAQDARMILAYTVLYPEVAAPFVETIAALPFPDRALADLWQQISDAILNRENLTAEELSAHIPADRLAVLNAETEMIRKSNRTAAEIQTVLSGMMVEIRRQSLQREIESLTTAYFQNPTEEVWEEIKRLKQEITALVPEE